jgi:hypothetical protein
MTTAALRQGAYSVRGKKESRNEPGEPALSTRPWFRRQESISRLLEAGITVLATLHLLSIDSAARSFASLVGALPEDEQLVNEGFMAGIHELELVDIPPQDLHGFVRGRSWHRPPWRWRCSVTSGRKSSTRYARSPSG